MVGKIQVFMGDNSIKNSQNSKTICTSSYHRKKVYKIPSESDEKFRRCRDKLSRTDDRTAGRKNGRTD